MSFLTPLFLAGIVALAVPILIHLTQRTKKEAVPFPSLMFLSRVPYKTTRRQQIRHWLLFLLRSAAIAILVFAFARPWLKSDVVGGTGLERAREVVILLDRSYSMAYRDRWGHAVDAALEIANGLGPDDRASLVLFAERAEVVHRPNNDQTALVNAIGRAALSSGTTRFVPGLQLAEQILEESPLARREAVLISDFQRSGWDEEEDAMMPAGMALSYVDVGEGETANIAVTDVSVGRSQTEGRERISAVARVVNLGPESADELQVSLEMDGQQISVRTVDIESDGSATVQFPLFTLPRRTVLGAVRVPSDGLPHDDVFHFLIAPGRTLSVLILEHPNAEQDESLFLQRALGIGSEPPYRIETKSAYALTTENLQGRAAVVLNDAPFPRGNAGNQLRRFVEEGGGLFVVLGQRSGSGVWPDAFVDLLPGRIGIPVDRLADRGATLNVTEYDHPLFELFRAPRSGDFSQTRFFRYRRIEETRAANVLARFDDGGLALAEVGIGEGKVLVWTSGMANAWNDFPIQPVFLPFVHQLGKYLADYAPAREWFTAGDVVDLFHYPTVTASVELVDEGDLEGLDVELVVESPSGGSQAVQVGGDGRYLTLEEQGYYRVRLLENNDGEIGLIAVNVNPVESDLTALDPEELTSAVAESGSLDGSADFAATITPAERERRQRVWWYLLILALFFLVAETALSNRNHHGAR